ncbi:MAG: hypothetical protein ROO76_10965 [Terriglobia bacterium]|jgi:hypothetical protein|nr:hypothetical protein [Terriglobia bacterium]
MQYLADSEYETYGLEAATPAALIASASSLIDSLCRRPALGVTQYTERIRIAPQTGRARLSYLPLCAVDGASSPLAKVRVRYGPSDFGFSSDLGMAVMQVFGLAGTWVDVDIAQCEFVAATGELIIPAQVLGVPYIEAEVTYTAGFATIPDGVKFACAQLVRNAQASPALNVRRSGLDKMQLEYFGASLADDDVKRLLAPFVAVRCGA